MKAVQKFSKEALFREAIQGHQCIAHLPTEKRRSLFDGLCWPLLQSISEGQSKHGKQPLFVGISAPQVCCGSFPFYESESYVLFFALITFLIVNQGCGKTTTTKLLSAAYEHAGMTCVSMSLDDFYLKGDDQERLAAKWPGNPLLQYRGNGMPQRKVLGCLGHF